MFTLDFRYYDTDLNKGDCNAFTSDHTARFSGDFTAIGWVRLQLVQRVFRRDRQVRSDGHGQSEVSPYRHDRRAAGPYGSAARCFWCERNRP